VPKDVVARFRANYDEWRDARAQAIARASLPSVNVATVTSLTQPALVGRDAQRPGDGATTSSPNIAVVTIEAARSRPAGRRFGTLVHATLANIALDAGRAAVAAMAATHGRITGATDDEVDAAVETIVGALRHALFEEAREAQVGGRCLREVPVTLMRDGVLLEGTVDLAFETARGMTVVDFKTNRADDEGLAGYERQLRLYADAVSQATGRPVTPVLLQL
jgi:ATP-dependent exoDNAse (exonuclease V) beta subunit